MGQWLVLIIILFTSFLQYKSNCASVLPPVYDLTNVGTVLFDKSDLSKRCWTDEEWIVLNSRREFQNLLPKFDNSSSIQNDQTIADILVYFNTCLEHVNELSTGNARRLMLRSLADAMGGYLHTYVAPLTKAAFYAGKVKYCNTVKLFRLLVEIKAFLITTGEGWMSPEHIDLFSNVTPLNLTLDPVENACDLLIFNYTGTSCKNGNFRNTVQSFELYLPYFDDDSRPNSIALPLKDRRLWSLYSEESVAILTRYYITSVYCIMSMNNYKENLAGFNKKFHEWLLQSVYPRLKDDRWYPAFGEILRVMALLAVISGNKYDDKKSSPIQIRNQTLDDTPKENITPYEDSKTASETFNTSQLIVIALLTAAIVWFLVCCSLCCYRSLRKHSSELSPCKSPVPRVNVLYENQNFGDLEICPSASSSKSMGKKIKDWWTYNVHCSGRCSKQHENDKFSAYKYESRETIRDRKQKKLSQKRKARPKHKTSMDTPTSSSCIVHYQKRVYYMRNSSSSGVSDSSFRQ
ncbi:hypothetical protein TKK_0008109 [Trichogramma kaykai]